MISVRVIPAVYRTSDEREVAYWTTGGDLWACYDGETAELIARNAVPAADPLHTATINGLGIIAGGGAIRVFDPQARTVVPFVPTAGDLPGNRGGGSFDVIGVAEFRLRVFYTMRAGVIASAIGDPYDVDTGALEAGSAYDIRASNRQEFGDDIVSVMKTNDTSLLFGTTTGIYAMIGDPVDGAIRQLPVTLDTGPSDWYAMTSIDASGRTVAHTPTGMLVFSSVDGGSNFSRSVVREGLETPLALRGRQWVTTVRDPSRGCLLVFKTNKASEAGAAGLPAAGLHYLYDEAQGGYQAGSPAFFPVAFANAAIDPTRAIQWRGRVLLGCADGYIRVFDDAAARDELTPGVFVTVDAFCEMTVVDAPGVIAGSFLQWVRPELTTTSGAVRGVVFGADGVASLFDPAKRFQLYAGDWVDGEVMMPRQRANALSVRISAASTNTGAASVRWGVEQIEAEIDAVPTGRRFAGGVGASLPSIIRPPLFTPTPPGLPPPDNFLACGDDLNPDTEPAPTGVISTLVFGTTTSTGQFIQPTVVVSNATGSFTYNWSVDGESVWATSDNAATPPSVEIRSGWKTLRVVITGGTLRTPLTVTRTVFVNKTGGTGSANQYGEGSTVDTPTTSTVEQSEQGRTFAGGQYEQQPAPSALCSINTATVPSPPAGYGGGTYASGGFP